MAIGWSETAPSDSSAANLADDELRSLKSNLAGGLANAVYWPGTGGSSLASAGQPLLGAWRAYYGVESKVSAYADGAMYITSDTSRLYGVGSSGTMFLGSASALEHTTHPGATNVRWVLASGSTTSSLVTFGISYNGIPEVTISIQTSGTSIGVPIWTSVTTANATPTVYNLGGTAFPTGAWTIHWQSVGTVTF